MNTILLIIAWITFIIYIGFVISNYGVLPSISDSYYKLKHKYWFTFFIWILAFAFIIVGSTGLMFYAGSFLVFVGVASAFKDGDMTTKIHVVGATGGIILGFASLVIDFHLYALPSIMIGITLFLILSKVKNYTWWIEVSAFVLMVVGLFIAKS